jgi:hypothetical protein
MKRILSLALAAVAIALLPVRSLAQGTNFFAQPFQYSDPSGTGVLTVTPLSAASTRLSFQPVQVTLNQNSIFSIGSGVYHAFSDDGADLPPFALLAFTLVDPSGNARFFQGTLAPVSGYTGEGTHHPVTSPQATTPWRVQSTQVPPQNVLTNSAPVLNQGWYQNSFAEAIGGVYYATYNTFQGAVSTATWTGNIPTPGNYQLEVFIPRQPFPGSVPRTNRATYQIYPQGFSGVALRTVNQQVTTSQWVPLGTFMFQGSYRIVLTDQTAEPLATRGVVANAIRLTPRP